jgi:hypothetical protein
MKKFLLIAVAVSSLLVASNGYACVGEDCKLDSNVQDTNDGNKGYIFTYCGEKGNNSLGTWVDPSTIPALKGDKGDTGERGETGATGQAGRDGQDGQAGINGQDGLDGQDGLNGTNGVDGQNGQDGYTPIKGVDYNDGKEGAVGETGSQGEAGQDGKTPVKGVDYNDGLNGTDGKTPIKNIDYFDGINGLNGKDVDPKTVNELNNKIDNNSNRIDRLEESQYIVGGVIRIKSTKKWDVDLFADYSTNRQMIDRSGIRFTYKVGESYQDLEMKKLENRIRALENK